MRALVEVSPTPEQLIIVSRNKPGIEVIRGAAGCGKTTTALLRLRALIGTFVSRKRRMEKKEPVRILVLTYNRTLRGYIRALARQQVSESDEIDLQISTFAKWAMENLGKPKIVSEGSGKAKMPNWEGPSLWLVSSLSRKSIMSWDASSTTNSTIIWAPNGLAVGRLLASIEPCEKVSWRMLSNHTKNGKGKLAELTGMIWQRP